MAALLPDEQGLPIPQYQSQDSSGFEAQKGQEGATYTYTKEGHNITLGKKNDAEVLTGDGTIVGILKAIRTKITSLVSIFDGTKPIGKVDVTSLPPLPAGISNIGKVDINSLPALPAGTSIIGKMDVNSLPTLPSGTNNIGKVDVNNVHGLIRSGSVYGAVSVTTTAIELKVGASKLANRRAISVYNNSATDITIGYDAGVTTTNGYPVKAGTERRFDLLSTETVALYAIGSGTSDVRIMETL